MTPSTLDLSSEQQVQLSELYQRYPMLGFMERLGFYVHFFHDRAINFHHRERKHLFLDFYYHTHYWYYEDSEMETGIPIALNNEQDVIKHFNGRVAGHYYRAYKLTLFDEILKS